LYCVSIQKLLYLVVKKGKEKKYLVFFFSWGYIYNCEVEKISGLHGTTVLYTKCYDHINTHNFIIKHKSSFNTIAGIYTKTIIYIIVSLTSCYSKLHETSISIISIKFIPLTCIYCMQAQTRWSNITWIIPERRILDVRPSFSILPTVPVRTSCGFDRWSHGNDYSTLTLQLLPQ
jgi:hypothetical protein